MDTTTTTTHHTDCRFISGSGWCCSPQCGRPVVAMAGRVVAAFATDTTVEIWCQSPTGGETDSLIFHMDCRTAAQAEIVASQWRNRWGIDA
jgi:hypothetical protein